MYDPYRKKSLQIKFKQKVIKQINTKNTNCGGDIITRCKEKILHQELNEHFKCEMTFLNHGCNTECPFNLKICNKSVTIEMLKKWYSLDSFCLNFTKPCQRTEYISQFIEFKYKKPQIYLSLSNQDVEHNICRISYTLSNLFGDIGGLLGLTLGYSGLSLAKIISKYIKAISESLKLQMQQKMKI